jgi:hypothetical protein
VQRILYVFILLIVSVQVASSEVIYVYIPDLSSKNIKDLQVSLDQINGLKYFGYCTDISVAKIDIDRTIHPNDSVLLLELKKLSFESIAIKSPVSEERFMSNCNHFEQRK